NRRAAERIDDREERGENEQHAFDDLAQVGGHGWATFSNRLDDMAMPPIIWRGRSVGLRLTPMPSRRRGPDRQAALQGISARIRYKRVRAGRRRCHTRLCPR